MRVLASLILLAFCSTPTLAERPGAAITKFGFEYFQKTSTDRNVAVSPLSLHAAFSMLCLGANGKTRTESLRVLGLNDSYGKEYSTFIKSLQPKVGKLAIASKVWPSVKLQMKPQFLSNCFNVFGAKPEAIDYSKTAAARSKINQWVSDTTEGQIKDLLPVGVPKSDTVLGLTNALYFEGQWTTPFPENRTEAERFDTPKMAIKVPMMKGLVGGKYYQNAQLEIVSLPYSESVISMAFIVPKKKDGWASVKPQVNSNLLQALELTRLGSDAKGPKIDLWLPRFKVRQSSQPIPKLRELGMTSLLGNTPELSGISTEGQLKVSECFHEAVVEVDEKGTKAAAATAVFVTRGASQNPQEPTQVRVDRPFYFVIYHRSTLAPLFIGLVVDPTE